MLAGLALSAALAALLLGPLAARTWLRRGLVRENYRGRRVAFPAGAPLVACSLLALAPLAVLDDRADLDLLDPELRRWIAYVLGVALLGLLDDALGRGVAADTPRGWRGHARAVLAGGFSTGAIKAVGRAGARRLRGLRARARGARLRRPTSPCCCSRPTSSTCSTCARAGSRRRSRCCSPASASAPGRSHPLELLGLFVGPVLVGAAFTLRERAMLGDTGSNLVGALAGISMLIDASARPGRWIALAVVVGADDLWGVSVDLRGDRADSAPAVARLARQSEDTVS